MPTIDALFLGATLHGIFLMCLLAFNRSENKQANIYLAALIGLLTLSLWNIYIYKSGSPKMWIIIDYILWATPYLWGPFLWAYVRRIIKFPSLSSNKLLLHCSPALIVAIMQGPLYLLDRADLISSTSYKAIYISIMVGLYFQMGSYVSASIFELKKYRTNIHNVFSEVETINLKWLRNLIWIFAVLILIDMCLAVPTTILNIMNPLHSVYMTAEAITLFAIGYYSLRQPEIRTIEKHSIASKYEGSPIDAKLGAELAQKLDQKMESSQIFLKNNLRLSDLADEMGLIPHHLSQIINQHRQKNFYDYVNEYRAQTAATTLQSSDKVNITKLAYDSGFNNRVSFNNAFRKHTGTTPSDYVKKHRNKNRLRQS